MRKFVPLLLVLSLPACAIIEDKVPVNYVSPPNLKVVDGASNVTVAISGEDQRVANKDRISTKKNGYGMEMAAIRAENDIVNLVSTAIERELSSLGFKTVQGGDGNVRAKVAVDTFYCDFKVGFFSGDAVAEVAFTLKATRSDGSLVYSRSYKGVGMNKDIMMASGSNAQVALQAALTNAMASVVGDDDLHKALIEAARAPRVAAAPSS
jgi:uncharacterized lipoprotein YajG